MFAIAVKGCDGLSSTLPAGALSETTVAGISHVPPGTVHVLGAITLALVGAGDSSFIIAGAIFSTLLVAGFVSMLVVVPESILVFLSKMFGIVDSGIRGALPTPTT